MITRSETVTYVSAIVFLLVIAIITPILATEASTTGDSTGLIIGIVGTAIVLILGLGFSLLIELIEQNS